MLSSGFADWDEDDVLAQVMAQSQQEYLESLRKHAATSSPPTSDASNSFYPPCSYPPTGYEPNS